MKDLFNKELNKTAVFLKHECPRWQQSPKLAILSTKVKATRSLTLVSLERVSLVEWPRLKFFCHRVADGEGKN